MDIISKDIMNYAAQNSSAEPGILQEINRETHVFRLFPRMISGHYQGRLLSMISKMIKPSCVLEIGTYTGYSTICLAEGLQVGGKIHSIEINIELEEIIRKNLLKAGVNEKVMLYFGAALTIIQDIRFEFDLAFIDADKINYIKYYETIISQIKPGGVIIADNVLWSGKVLDKTEKDKEAEKLIEFNRHVTSDPRVENILLPIRDGIMLIRKHE